MQTSADFQVPDHVPAHLVWNHDVNAFASELDDPFIAAARLHEGPDLVYSPGTKKGDPCWIPTRFKLMNDIYMDARRFSSAENINVNRLLGVEWKLNPLEIDPPAHMAYRQILQPWFQPSAINAIEDMIRGVARELIAQFKDRGSCEFVADFASLFPSYIFLEMLGLPREMLGQFLEWEHIFVRSAVLEDRIKAAHGVKNYLEEYVAARRGDDRGDMVSAILKADIKGRPLDHGEIMGMVMVLYFGGLDTVASSVGWHMRHVATDRALQARLRANPDELPGAVDDLLRAYGVVSTRRIVAEDLTIDGVEMRKGDFVLMPTYLASRDPLQFDDPHQVDPARKARHISLATGVHNCLGAHLAKRELKIVLEEFLAAFSDIRIAEGERVEFQTEGVWAVTRMPMLFTRSEAR
ncbi:MAG: cytochrome P450 [Sphingobium sp.]